MYTTPATAPANGCAHDNPSGTVRTREGGRVCGCGAVPQEGTAERFCPSAAAPGRVPPYHRVENGGSPADMRVVSKRIHIHPAGSSEFPNMCGKLEMQDCVRDMALNPSADHGGGRGRQRA